MIGTTKEYNMAVALLHFKSAYQQLVKASKELPDLDVSEGYPFFLLDFEVIESAVVQWCTLHASRLMEALPDIVPNPTCMSCEHFGSNVNASGLCEGNPRCTGYPVIPYSAAVCRPALIAAGYNIAQLSESEVELLYIQEVQKRVNESKNKPV